MDGTHTKAKLDWLVELAGAWALAMAGGYAAWKAAPSFDWPGAAAMTGGGFGSFALGMLAMRAVPPEPRTLVLATFDVEALPSAEPSQDEPLLLDILYEDPLLLDDPLVEPNKQSRVVQLFESPPVPTPGQLKDRIDRHLAGAAGPPPLPMPPADASRALYAALADLRRSLR